MLGRKEGERVYVDNGNGKGITDIKGKESI